MGQLFGVWGDGAVVGSRIGLCVAVLRRVWHRRDKLHGVLSICLYFSIRNPDDERTPCPVARRRGHMQMDVFEMLLCVIIAPYKGKKNILTRRGGRK